MTPESYEEDEGPGLMFSPYFYFGLAVSVALWSAFFVVIA